MKIRSVVAVGTLFVLVGCGISKDDDIHQWMVEERNQTRPKVVPIPAPKQFKPEAYVNGLSLIHI
jgi:type IV pilus assembly protein PilP